MDLQFPGQKMGGQRCGAIYVYLGECKSFNHFAFGAKMLRKGTPPLPNTYCEFLASCILGT